MCNNPESIPDQIRCATPDEISDIITTAVQRFYELFPDWDILVATLPRNDFDEQIRILQNMIDLLTRLKDEEK